MVRCGCGGTVMPTFEWTAVGDEPGCRQVAAAAAAAMDPQIKLFGQTISVSPSHTGAGADAEFLNPSSAYTAPPSSQDGGDSVQQRGAESKGASESLVRALSSSRDDELLQLHVKSRECGVAPASGVPHLCDEQSEGVVSDEQSVGSDGSKSQQQKVEKVVPCPRCSSEDTKFCYYNNYNVNQPRHFCKNCQRYWTAGGTLRNVPVGAGRRKNKASGGVHRENNEASSFQMELGEFSCGVRSPKVKASHGKRVAGQGSPVRSPGSSTSLGQESGLSMSSPPYSLYQNGRQSLQSFISVSHGFNTSGTEANRMGSSDSASTMRGGERLAQFFPGGNDGGYDEDCRRLSLQSKQMQDAGAHNESSDTGVSGWVGNFGGRQPVQFSNGPHGYLADWDGKHHHSAVSQPFTSGAAGVTTPPAWASTPWASTPWASSHPSWTGNPHHALHGKRQNSEVVEDCYSAKRLRTEVESKREWPVVHGRTLPESDILKQLLQQQPKLEHLGAACEPKHSFMSRLFNNTTGPWPVPFPVAI